MTKTFCDMITDFKLVQATSAQELSEAVSILLKEGWLLRGKSRKETVTYPYSSPGGGAYGGTHVQNSYMQDMIKHNDIIEWSEEKLPPSAPDCDIFSVKASIRLDEHCWYAPVEGTTQKDAKAAIIERIIEKLRREI